MKIIAFILGCLLFSMAEIHGQDTPKDLSSLAILPLPLPAGDLITKPSNPAKWIVNSIPVSQASTTSQPTQPPPKATVLTYTKSNNLYLVESVNTDGRKLVRWKDHQFQATYLPGAAHPVVAYSPTILSDGSVAYYLDFSKSDLPEFSWISASNYVGMAKLGGDAMGLVFKSKVSAKGLQMTVLTMSHDSREDAIAVIDAKTHLPLMLQVGGELLLYQFTNGASDLTLPVEAKQAFDSFRKQMRQAASVPPG